MRLCQCILAFLAALFLFGRGAWRPQSPQEPGARRFRVLPKTVRSITARRTRGMARDWCGSAARRRAKRVSRGATTKRESGWTRDAAVSLLWDAVKTAAMLAAKVLPGR